MKKNRLYWLSLAFLLAMLPVMILRDFTPSNELRYLSIADEALRDGHLFAFTNQGEPYADKPPLYIWIVMLGKILFGEHHMWFLSLFSLLPALGILFTMDRWVSPALDERGRTAAALMLMTCGLFLGLAVFLRMDMLMCLFITLALYFFWRMYTGTGNPATNRLFFPLCVLLALFTKGPVGILVPLLSTLAFLIVRRQLKTFGRYWGWRTWGIIGAGCALWFAEVWLEGGTEYLDNLLFHQTLDRAVDAFHHKEPVWYYFVSMWYSLAPWSLLIVGVTCAALVRRMELTALEQFFLTVILTTLAMLSAFSSKIAVYLAPTFPFFVYLTVLLAARMRTTGWIKAAVALPAAVWMAVLPAVIVSMHYPEFAILCNGWCVAAAGILFATGLTVLILVRKRSTLHEPIGVLAAGLILASCIGSFTLPKLNAYLGYGDLCREAKHIAQTNRTATFYTWKMHRPDSMDVYLGEDIVEVTEEELLSGRCSDGVLMLPIRKLSDNADMQKFIAGMRSHEIGQYLLVEINQTPKP